MHVSIKSGFCLIFLKNIHYDIVFLFLLVVGSFSMTAKEKFHSHLKFLAPHQVVSLVLLVLSYPIFCDNTVSFI